MSLQFTLVSQDDGRQAISVFVPGQTPQVAVSDHPNFDAILTGALAGDESVIELFDVSATVATRFEGLSERVTVANGRVYFDGDEVDNSLTKQILRFLDSGDDFGPLVNFFEKVQQNPEPHSRENLYRWLEADEWTLAANGDIIGYKGVAKAEDGGYLSISSGKAIVNGEVVNGRIPTNPGDIIEMPRSEVAFDPGVGCSTGLHVGTWEYAAGFGRGAVLEVRVNPRDVVSVPTDSGDQKMRVCRYEILGAQDVAYDVPVVYDYEDDEDLNDWSDGEYDDMGEGGYRY